MGIADRLLLYTARRSLAAAVALALAVAACSSQPEDPVWEAQVLLYEERIDEAILLLEDSLDLSPDDYPLNHLYGVTLLSVGEASLAIWPLRRAVSSPDAAPQDWLLLAQAHLQGGSASDAISVIDDLHEQTPDVLEAYQIRIAAHQKLNRKEHALTDVEYVLGLWPDNRSMMLERATLLLELERREDANEAIAAALAVVQVPEVRSQWAARFCAIGVSLTFKSDEEGHLDRAREEWEGCLDSHPTDEQVVTDAIGFFDGQREFDRSLEILREAVAGSPESVGIRISLGQRLAALGEEEEAEQQLRQALESPDGGPARTALIDYYTEREEFDKALGVLENWIAEMPEPSAYVRTLYADILILSGNFVAAEKAIVALGEAEYANLLRGRLELERGNPARALELLEQGIQLWPSNAVGRILMAEAAEQMGDLDRAISEYVEALRNDPSNWEALSELAQLQEPLRQLGSFRQLLQRYIEEEPNEAKAYELQFQVGVWSREENLVQGALRALQDIPGQEANAVALTAQLQANRGPAAAVDFIEEKALDLTLPENAPVLATLVEQLSATARHDDALSRADAAIAAHPDVAVFHELRGLSLEKASKPAEEIRAELERALELEPARVDSLRGLGRLAAQQDDLDAALAAFDLAAAADPADPTAEWEAIQALLAAGGAEAVDSRLSALLADHLQHAGAGDLMARRILARGDDLDSAQRHAERAVRLGGGAEALTTLGSVYRRQGDMERAIPPLRRSLRLRPDNPSARYELGVALARSGNAEAARVQLGKALESEAFAEQEAARKELAGLDG